MNMNNIGSPHLENKTNLEHLPSLLPVLQVPSCFKGKNPLNIALKAADLVTQMHAHGLS